MMLRTTGMQSPNSEERRLRTQADMAKLPYWLDANIFIEANNTFFNIEIAPSFWAWLETKLKT